MADSLKLATKDLAKKIVDRASPSKVKFVSDKIVVEAVVQAEELKQELKGKEWSTLASAMEAAFEDLAKDLEKSIAGKVEKADKGIATMAEHSYGNFLAPVNHAIEHKFEEHCKRIHLVLAGKLQEAKKEHKDLKKDAKVRVEFDLCALVSSSRRVVSSSSSEIPKVNVVGETKDAEGLAKQCSEFAQNADKQGTRFRGMMKLSYGLDSIPAPAIAAFRRVNLAYNENVDKLEKKLSELRDSVHAELNLREEWKKKFGAIKPTISEENIRTVKKLIGEVVKRLQDLKADTIQALELIRKEGSAQHAVFTRAIDSLESDKKNWDAAKAALNSSFSAYASVKKVVEDAEHAAREIRKKLDDLNKAAVAK